MALIVADKIKVRSYSSGTGSLILESALPGFRSFAAIGAGNDCFYGIEDTAGNWEVGRATYSVISGIEQLSRIDVSSSSNNNTIVNFPAGAKTVFCTIPSAILNGLIADSQDTFRIISVSGQDDLVAGNSGDTITYVGGPGISITTDSVTDTITFANSTVISYTGGTGISLDGASINHINSVTAATASEGGAVRTLTAGSSFNVPSLTYDAQGHITASSLTTLTLPADPNALTLDALSVIRQTDGGSDLTYNNTTGEFLFTASTPAFHGFVVNSNGDLEYTRMTSGDLLVANGDAAEQYVMWEIGTNDYSWKIADDGMLQIEYADSEI